MANMQGMNGADIQGNMFSLGYNSMFNQPDASFQGQHQMMQQTAMIDGNSAAGGGMGPKARAAVAVGRRYRTKKVCTLGQNCLLCLAHNLQTQHLRRNSSSFQHLGMIEGVLDGDELRQENNPNGRPSSSSSSSQYNSQLLCILVKVDETDYGSHR